MTKSIRINSVNKLIIVIKNSVKRPPAAKISIPGAWNAADQQLLFYRGPVWLFKKFDYSKQGNQLTHIYFEGSNFTTKIFLNGQSVGEFKGGYVPFNFDITDYVKEGENILLVLTDNTLNKSTVPTNKTDWWPWGGLIGDVYLIETPQTFILNAFMQLDSETFDKALFKVQLSDPLQNSTVTITIPELKFQQSFLTVSMNYFP